MNEKDFPMKVDANNQETSINILNNNNTNKNVNKNSLFCWKKNKKIIIITLISSIIFIVGIVLLCVFLTKKEKEIEYENEKEIENENEYYIIGYIIGTYKAEKGVPLKLFNPSKIGLKDENYKVEEITQNNNNNNQRRLQQINIKDGIFIPEKNGNIQFNITFNESLTILDFMFEGCSNLIKINLSTLNSSNITSMMYTFTNCIQLEIVDFTSFQSSSITRMDFLFSGCSNLVNINGFEDLDTSSLIKTAGMFLGCTNLVSLNLSSLNFNDISEQNGMFINNPSLESIDLGEVSDINNLFSSSEDFHVNIITSSNSINSSGLNGTFDVLSREENDALNCSLRNYSFFTNIFDSDYEYEESDYYFYDNFFYFSQTISNTTVKDGYYWDIYKRLNLFHTSNEMDKCTQCDEGNRKMYCKSCRIGYYLPKGIDYSQKRCRRCDEGCIKCIPDEETDESICIKCENENNLFPSYNDENSRYYDGEDFFYLFLDDFFYYEQDIGDKYFTYYNSYYVYKLNNGKCIKQCKLGKGNKCKSCNLEEGKTGECLTCNVGYYFDENENKTICQKINIERCTQAVVESGNVKCTNCSIGYIVYNNSCVKACDIGYGENNCASCNQTYEYRNSCASCYYSYYLKTNYEENKMSCYRCSNEDTYCNECELTSGKFKCKSCRYDSFLLNGVCIKSCNYSSCLNCIYENDNYVCGQCKENYYLNNKNGMKYCELCRLGCKTCSNDETCINCQEGYKLEDDICKFYCEIGNKTHCSSCDFNEKNKCKECYSGYFLPEGKEENYCYSCGENCVSCQGKLDNPVCTQCKYGFNLTDGKCIKQCNLGNKLDYCKTCDSENQNYCGSCFDGYYISLYYKSYCSYCGSNKIKQCHQNYNGNIIIDECYSDYILIRNKCVEKCDSTNYRSHCLICHEEENKLDQCKQCKEGYYVPNDLEQLSYCYSCPSSCQSCEGSFYNPICTKCKIGYKLSGGKCLKECTTGSDNYCKNCNTEEGKIDQCLECNDGYYLSKISNYDYYYNNSLIYCSVCPNNCTKCKYNEYKADCTECKNGYYLAKQEYNEYSYYYNPIYYNKCEECSIPGCIDYEPNLNKCICKSCIVGLSPKRDKNTNEIISCYDGCDLGELEKCKSCDQSGKCGDCNEDYVLINGKCIGDYHLFAKYKTTYSNEKVQLFYVNNMILKMKVDGVVVNIPNYYYTFSTSGEHEVYIRFSEDVSFMDLFYNITHVTYIEFLPNAKKYKINYMNDCFYGCTNLEYVDLSNLDLTNNRCFMNFFSGDKNLKTVIFPEQSFRNIYWYYNMFKDCESLTSINMSMIHNTNGEYFYQMFYGCKNLKSIDLSNFDKYYQGYSKYSIFNDVPKDAIIKIHQNFYNTVKDQLTGFTNLLVVP